MDAATTGQQAERELRIEIWPDELAQFEGAKAQLEAEGLIPKDFEWPQAAADKHWEANGYSYSLHRTRPAGHKGPMRSWLELDNWSVRIEVNGRGWHWRNRRAIERKAEELQAEIYRQSPAGRRESSARWEAYWAAHEDKAFQRFKAIFFPERKKPGRKPKIATQGERHA